MQNKLTYNNGLTTQLIDYLKTIDLNEPLEVKPVETLYTSENDDLHKKLDNQDLEVLNKDYSTKLDKQLKNVGNNIVIKFFELNDDKFQAIMSRITLWRI